MSDHQNQSGEARGLKFPIILLIHCLALVPFLIVLSQLLTNGPSSSAIPFFEETFEKDPVLRAKIRREPVALESKTSERGLSKHEIHLSSSLGKHLEGIKSIGILMATYNNRVDVVSAELEFLDNSTGKIIASFRADPNTDLLDNRMLMFSRDPSPGSDVQSDDQSVAIRITRKEAAPLAIWGIMEGTGPRSPHLWQRISNNGKPEVVSFLGVFDTFEKIPAKKRFHLLAATWGISQERAWLILLPVFLAGALWIAGTGLSVRPSPQTGRMAFQAVSSGCLFLGLALLYSTLIPPFQAPDEPDHFLTFASLTGRKTLEADALDLANAGHFDRIKRNLDQHFAAADVGNPLRSKWSSEIEKTDVNRSPLTQILWPIFAKFLPLGAPGPALFSLRVTNALIVALSLVAALVCLGCLIDPVPLSIVSSGPFLMVPTFCLYAVAVSNYPFLIAGYIFQTAALSALWIGCGERRTAKIFHAALGCLVTMGLLVSMAGGDSGVFGVAFWAVLLPFVFFFRGTGTQDKRSETQNILCLAATTTGTLMLAKIVALIIFPEGNLLPEKVGGRIGEILAKYGVGFLPPETTALLLFVLAATLGSFLMLHAGWRAGRWTCEKYLRFIPPVLLGLLAAFVLLAPGFQVPDIENPYGRISFAEYLVRLLHSFAEGFGPGFPDLYTTRLFWGGFGWMETQMPGALVDFLRYGILVGLFLLMMKQKHRDDALPSSQLLLANLLALSALLIVTAYAYYFLGINLQGRYLLMAYLFVMVPAYEGFRRLGSLPSSGSYPAMMTPIFCVVCSVIHSVVFCQLLNRYF